MYDVCVGIVPLSLLVSFWATCRQAGSFTNFSWLGFYRLARQPKKLVGAIFVQITGEFALIFAGEKRQFIDELFAVVTRYLDDSIHNNSLAYPQANAWFLMKQAFVKKDISAFLKRSSNFLDRGRAYTLLLWYATVIDFLDICDPNIP